MRQALTLLLALIFTGCFAQKADTTVQVHGRIILGNRGFAPVPAFSFNYPLAIGFFSARKKNFAYDPDASIGLNGKPWMANNWFRYYFLQNKTWKTNVGLNPSLFFKNEILDSGDEIVHAHRNLTFEATTERTFRKWSVRFNYMLIHAFDQGTLSGHFVDASASFTAVQIRQLSFKLKPELFYFNFDGNVDGFFSSAVANLEHARLPVSIYFQAVQPIWSGFPGNSFKWNTGIVYTF